VADEALLKSNLQRWQESGRPRAWVARHNGQWNHDDWITLLEELKGSDFWPLEPDAVGALLEAEKRAYRKTDRGRWATEFRSSFETIGKWLAARFRAVHVNRKKILDHVDILGKLITTVAILVGGIWAYRNFVLERTDIPNAQVLVDSQVLPYSKDKVLLVVNVTLKNAGKRVVKVGEKGCTVSVMLIPQDEPLTKRLKFSEGQAVVKDENILDEYYRGE
jgi:hypothetical protein